MALTAGIFSNAYRLALPPAQRFWRISLQGDEAPSRRQLERELGGIPVWIHNRDAYTCQPVPGGEEISFSTEMEDKARLVSFAIRESLRAHARERGWEEWLLMNELHAVPPDNGREHGPVLVEPLLKMRVAHEGMGEREFVLVASSGVRWRMVGTLADSELAAVAEGESVFRLGGDGPERGSVERVDGDAIYVSQRGELLEEPLRAEDYSLVARPGLVHSYLARTTGGRAEAANVYRRLLVASGTLLPDGSPNRYAAKERYQSTETLLAQLDRKFDMPTGQAEIAATPIEIFVRVGQDLELPQEAADQWVGSVMHAPRLRFGQGVPSRADDKAWRGLRRFGAFSLHKFPTQSADVLLVYPRDARAEAHTLRDRLFNGFGQYPGFKGLFGLPPKFELKVSEYVIEPDGSDAHSGELYKRRLEEWARSRDAVPDLAVVMHPISDRWETDSAYYAAKVFFGREGVPTQMVTSELATDSARLGWSLANIALATFAKLGGRPWVVDARGEESDLVIGIGRADIRDGAGRRRIFGYAVAVISNGAYLDLATADPASDEGAYQKALTKAVKEALETLGPDNPPSRIVIHLAKRTGKTEIQAVQAALKSEPWAADLPTAFLRVDDSSLFEFLNGEKGTYAAPKGLTVRLGERRALVQTEEASTLGPARRPLLLELDTRSTVGPEELGRLTRQVFRLAHANWRGLNARSKPVTIFYGEQLAELAGYIAQSSDWDPTTLKPELRQRPWFL